jgi:hypothetical protein
VSEPVPPTTTQTITIRAAEGRLVRHPHTRQALPTEGHPVSPDDPYWYRRWLEGDVEIIDPMTRSIVSHPAHPAPEEAAAETAPAKRQSRPQPVSAQPTE